MKNASLLCKASKEDGAASGLGCIPWTFHVYQRQTHVASSCCEWPNNCHVLICQTRAIRRLRQEAKHQASTTLAMLSRFGTQYRAALLLETGLLVSLVDRCAESPHNVALDVACAVVNLCDTDSAPLQQQV